MIYVNIGRNFTIVEILSEKQYFVKFPGKRNTRKDTEITSSGSSYYYTFYDIMDTKINVALERVKYFERKMLEHDEQQMRSWYGDSHLGLAKTKKWLDRQELIFPEYFL